MSLATVNGIFRDLRRLLEKILPQNSKFDDFPVEHEFPGRGRRRMILNARKIVQRQGAGKAMILLAIEDVTDKTMQQSQ